MKKGDLVEFKKPLEDEIGLTFILLEDPDGDRVLAEALVDMEIHPTYILKLTDIRLVLPKDSAEL